MPLAEFIAARLRKLRAQCGLTQEQPAALLGADARWYQRLERCEKDVRVSTVDRLAAAFGLTAVEFLAAHTPKAKLAQPSPAAPHKPRRTTKRRRTTPRT